MQCLTGCFSLIFIVFLIIGFIVDIGKPRLLPKIIKDCNRKTVIIFYTFSIAVFMCVFGSSVEKIVKNDKKTENSVFTKQVKIKKKEVKSKLKPTPKPTQAIEENETVAVVTPSPTVEVKKTETPKPKASPKQKNKQKPSPTVKLTKEEEIKKLIKDEFYNRKVRDKSLIRSIEVIEQLDSKTWKENGEYGVKISFNASDGFTNSSIKSGIEIDMKEMYDFIYNKELKIYKINWVMLTAFFPLTDEYGNSKDEEVYITVLDRRESQKVNTEKYLVVLPNIWTEKFVHPAFDK